jgi:type I restriction-modification system DNA methylase subunit
MCKMNVVLHGIVDLKIEYGDVPTNPKPGTNFLLSMDLDNKSAAKDPCNNTR